MELARRTVRAVSVLAAALVGVTAALVAVPASQAADPPALAATDPPLQSGGTVTELGMPIVGGKTSPDLAYGHGPDGEPQVYFFFNGSSTVRSQFAVLDVRTQEVVFHQRVPRGSSTWGVDFSEADGAAYFATADTGDLYRYVPGTTEIEHLGRPAPGLVAWSLLVDPSGVVWMGTYPEARVVSYDPATGATRDYGRMSESREYVGALEWHDGAVYAGLKSPNALVRLDPVSGATQTVELGEEWGPAYSGVRDLHSRGDYLLVALEASASEVLLFFNPATGLVEHADPDYRGREVSQVAPDGVSVYYRSMNGRTSGAAQIVRYDLTAKRVARAVPWAPNAVANVLDFVDMGPGAAPGEHLVMCAYQGRCYTRSLSSTEGTYVDVTNQIEPTGARIIRTQVGPDDKVYFSGYLSPPGMGQWDPETERFTLLGGTGQLEGIGTFGDDLVLGRYPGAGLMTWDPDEPWPGGSFVYPARADQQDRPMDFLDLGDSVLAATTPTAQNHGGALVRWDGRSGTAQVYRDLVPGHTPITLAESGGLVWAGTSRHGGYGIGPVDGSAQLFAWDPETGEVVHTMTVVEGALSVNGLAVDPVDGTLWGLVRGSVFHVDPVSREVLSVTELYEENWTGSQFQEEFDLRFDDEGRLFGLSEGRLFHLDTTTLRARTLVAEAHGFDVAEGSVYFTVDSTAYRYDLPANLGEPACDTTVSGRHPGPVVVETGTTCLVGTIVSGPVSVAAGATLVVDGGTLHGGISADGAAEIVVVGATVSGGLHTTGTTGLVSVVDSRVNGAVDLLGSRATLVAGSTITGPVTCSGPEPTEDGRPSEVIGPVGETCGDLRR